MGRGWTLVYLKAQVLGQNDLSHLEPNREETSFGRRGIAPASGPCTFIPFLCEVLLLLALWLTFIVILHSPWLFFPPGNLPVTPVLGWHFLLCSYSSWHTGTLVFTCLEAPPPSFSNRKSVLHTEHRVGELSTGVLSTSSQRSGQRTKVKSNFSC